MAVQTAKTTLAAFDAFRERPENAGKRFELIEGEIAEMPGSTLLHGLIVAEIFGLLLNFVKQHRLGYVVTENYDFVLNEETTLQPDAAFIRRERLAKIPKRMQGAPDLAVEVASPSNSRPEMMRKVALAVWVVLPESRQVLLCVPGEAGSYNVRLLNATDRLEGGAVLPGFSAEVGELFPDVEIEEEPAP